MKNKLIIVFGIVVIIGVALFILIKTDKINLSKINNSFKTTSNTDIDHISAKELDKMDVSKVLNDLSKEDKSLIKNEDGTYSSVSKKKALEHNKKLAKDILNDEKKAEKYREQRLKEIEENGYVIVTEEMENAGLYGSIN